MATLYVRSTDGSDADNGSTWALAKATLAGAYTAAAAGDIIYVSGNHAETQATNMTLLSPGTAALPCYVICVDDSAEPPTALATTATITTTAATSIAITTGFAYYYGITFRGGTSGSGASVTIAQSVASPYAHYLTSCSIGSGDGLTGSSWIVIGSSSGAADDQLIVFDNVTTRSVGTIQIFSIAGGRFIWKNTPSAITGTALPTVYFNPGTSGQLNRVDISGVDFSALGSGKSLVLASRGSCSSFRFRNCKLGSSVSLTSGTIPGPGGCEVGVVNCDSADTNYRYWYQDYAGTVEHETTIVRNGGATDGTTSISREMVSTANCSKFYPLVLGDIIAHNNTTGSSVTITMHIVTDNVTLTDQEIWLEVEYLGTSGFPLASFADDRDSITDLLLGGSASNQATSTEAWTTTGIGTPVYQKLEVSVTPQKKGPIRCRVMLGKASTTVWVCPEATVTGITSTVQYQAGVGEYVLEPAGGGVAAGSFIHSGSGRGATY